MAREKRKGRLDKTNGTATAEFIGFSSFSISGDEPTSSSQSSSSSWSPVYMGSDTTLQQLFPRISQKRDSTTKVKALQDLQTYFGDDDIPRRNQVDAIQHFAWLYFHKIHYDGSPLVRDAALNVWIVAMQRTPKALVTLFTQTESELVGMLFASQADPAIAVQSTGRMLVTSLNQQAQTWPWNEGFLQGYAKRILTYGRASVFHQALFTKGEDSSKQTFASDEERDKAEERFERIVGTCLDALHLWVTINMTAPETSLWWKTLSALSPALRLKTYRLLASSCAHKLPLPENLPQQLASCLSTEKHVTNIPDLLGTVVAVCSCLAGPHAHLGKPVTKILKKACYGAPTSSWGPVLLPLTALIESDSVFHAAWDGREICIGDVFPLALAVAECASFTLLSKNEQHIHHNPQEVAQLWLDVLRFYLTTTKTGSQRALVQQLGNDLARFQQKRVGCSFHSVYDWFWDKGMDWSGSLPQNAAIMLRTQPIGSEKLLPHFRLVFGEVISMFQGSSGVVPSLDAYSCFIAILESFQPRAIIPDGLERFIMNDLLRWAIIHTSELSEHLQSEQLVMNDFHLIRLCLESEERRDGIWNVVLREILSSKPNLRCLINGFKPLVTNHPWTVACQHWRDFAILQGAKSAQEVKNSCDSSGREIATDEIYHDQLDFFRLCLGLLEGSTPSVDKEVIRVWVENACLIEVNTPLLEVLLETISNNSFGLLCDDEVQSIILHSWATGGALYSKLVTISVWGKHSEVLTKAARFLKFKLKTIVHKSFVDREDMLVVDWSQKALRFIDARSDLQTQEVTTKAMFCLFDFADKDITLWWKQNPSAMYVCSMELFRLISSIARRQDILKGSSNLSAAETLLLVCKAIVTINCISTLDGDMKLQGQDRCELFVAYFDGKQHESRSILIDATEQLMQNKPDMISRSNSVDVAIFVSVLSVLIEAQYTPVSLRNKFLSPDELKEGQEVLYVSEPGDISKLELVTIRKKHYDAQAGYYFTIAIQRGCEIIERQTVISRLVPLNSQGDDEISETEKTGRTHLAAKLWNTLIKPSVKEFNVTETFAIFGELIAILGGVVSLGHDRGVGSCHYDVFQFISELDKKLRIDLNSDHPNLVEYSLWATSLALGYGLNCRSRPWSVAAMGLDFIASSRELLNQRDRIINSKSLCRAFLVWSTSTLGHTVAQVDRCTYGRSGDVHDEVLRLLFQLSASLLSCKTSREIDADISIASRAVSQGIKQLRELSLSSPISDIDFCSYLSESNVLDNLVLAFTETDEGSCHWRSDVAGTPRTSLHAIYGLALVDVRIRRSLVSSCSGNNAAFLARALFNGTKRGLAFQLLHLVTADVTTLRSKDAIVSNATASLLSEWTAGMNSDEAAELEEDVYIVAEWIPSSMMLEIESWQHSELETLDQDHVVGHMLSWLVFLGYTDAAASKDFRNRPAFISYVGKCAALSHVVTLALLHDPYANNLNRTGLPSLLLVEDLLSQELFEPSDLASVAMFRSVEVFPSLSRRFFDEDCPKVYLAPFHKFVEKHVSPIILKREFERIKNVKSVFGDMNVTSSTISREVSAEYVQDDFVLKVLISLPPAFPFRSAEVDCSKTLGVPQSRWKRWSLQIMMMLNKQGGTLEDALLLWKENVDKEFEGVEPCPVCYSVLHVKSHKLPCLECKTCSNRFHVECLNQWFNSSGKSQCVLCQQPWQGARV